MTRVVRSIDHGIAFLVRAGRGRLRFTATAGGVQLRAILRPLGGMQLAQAIGKAAQGERGKAVRGRVWTPLGPLYILARRNPGYVTLTLNRRRGEIISVRLDAATAEAVYGELMEAAAIARSAGAGEGNG